MFSSLKRRSFSTEKQMKYFNYKFKQATIFLKLHLLPRVYKRLHNVSGRPVISNCGSPTERCPELLDHHLKSIMQKCWSYIKDSGVLLTKPKTLALYLIMLFSGSGQSGIISQDIP